MQTIGKSGEDKAEAFLKNAGYSISKRNYRYKHAEIDIICVIDDLLVFVEVKTRTSTSFGQPESFVTENQQASIIRGAEQYLKEQNWEGDIRFDILAIVDAQGRVSIEHFKDAFY